MLNYGERTCLECGKKFTAAKLSQVTCSEQCYRERRLKQHRISNRKRYYAAKEKYASLEADIVKLTNLVESQKHQIVILENANAELAAKIAEDKKAAIAPKDKELELEKCLRSNAKALHLPCGKNPMCWEGSPCERCEGMQKPDFKDWNNFTNLPPKKEQDNGLEKHRYVTN